MSEDDISTLPWLAERFASVGQLGPVWKHFGMLDSARAKAARGTSLSPSLLADLQRFQGQSHGAELLEVLAASVRHARPLVVFLSLDEIMFALRLFPLQWRFSCPSDLLALSATELARVRVVRVEPGSAFREADPGAEEEELPGGALSQLVWQIAMKGHRDELLPEIGGRATYRISRAISIENLPANDATIRVLRRLRTEALTFDDIVMQPGMDAHMASRLLNALYLQAGLITLRAGPRPSSSLWKILFRRSSR